MIQVGESQNKKKDLRWFLGFDLDYNIHLHLLFFFVLVLFFSSLDISYIIVVFVVDWAYVTDWMVHY